MKVEIPNQLLVKVSGMVSRGIKEAEINVDGILVFTLTDGTKLELGSVKGDQGPRGESGVYVGTGEMPVDCNVQIDPSGEAFEFIQPPKIASVGQALLVKSVDETGKPTEWETGEVTGGTGGTSDHSKLSNRDAADQHPIGAITGLEAALAGKQPAGDYLTEEFDPTVPAWAKEAQKPSYTASEVGADPSGTAAGLVSSHNTAEAAHNDIRLLISELTDRLNALADSDDTTLDQFSEVVAYIKANRELIASITTDKVSVTDIVNDLVTNVTNKPLSAAQGVALKALIDAISIPTQLPNPNALTFTGAATGSYDGSAPMTVEIPSGGSGGSAEPGYKDAKKLFDVTLDDTTGGLKNYEYDVSGIEKTDVIIINILFPESYSGSISIKNQSNFKLADEFPNGAKGIVVGIKAMNGRYLHSAAYSSNVAARLDAPLSLFYGQLNGSSGFERPKAQDTITKLKFILANNPFVSGTRIRAYRW